MRMHNSANINAYNKQTQETKDGQQQEISESETTSFADFLQQHTDGFGLGIHNLEIPSSASM